jgi:long-chain acyl-CoA synthetase
MIQPFINRSHPGKTALITQHDRITYSVLLKRIEQYANLFSGKGYARAAIYAENSPEWIYAFYASLRNGCVPVPIDFMASAEDVAYIIDDCRPELLFISEGMKAAMGPIDRMTVHKPEVIVIGDIAPDDTVAETQWTGPADIDDTAVIIYTSGTTGSPKGVMLSFRNIHENMNAVIDCGIFTPDREVMIFLPLHHVFPLVGSMITPLYVGATIPMAPSMQSSDLMKTFAENRVAIFLGVPRLYELMYRGIRSKIDHSAAGRLMLSMVMATKSRWLGRRIFGKVHQGFGGHLKFMIAGGAALNKEIGYFFHYLGFDIMEGFGMTEAAPMITFPRPGKVIIGSTGQALPGLQVEIRDGEIVAKGPSIMKGYYNRPEETAEVIREGWLFTGDLGYLDANGYLFITGRKKEIIVLPNGKNINPVEIEMKLDTFSPAIRESGVFLHHDLLHAVILPDYGYLAANGVTDARHYFREEIIAPFNAGMTSYKRVIQFTLVRSELPRTRLSKLQRFKLPELLEMNGIQTSVASEPDTSEYRAIKSYLESQVDMDILPEHHLVFDVALDSLGKMGLIDYIEKTFGLKLEDEQLIRFPSIRKIAEHIQNNKLFHKTEPQSGWAGDLKNETEVRLPRSSLLMRPVVMGVRGFFRLFFRFEGKGMENIPEGPCLITPNHESLLDAFLVLSYLDRKTMKSTFSYAKRDHAKDWIRRFLAHNSNVIIMDLTKDLKGSIHKLAEVVKLEKKVLIFPEGTRTRDGRLGKFMKTYAILSTELQIPILPVAIHGAFRAMSSGDRKIKAGEKITIEFLPVIQPENLTADELNSRVRNAIIKVISN